MFVNRSFFPLFHCQNSRLNSEWNVSLLSFVFSAENRRMREYFWKGNNFTLMLSNEIIALLFFLENFIYIHPQTNNNYQKNVVGYFVCFCFYVFISIRLCKSSFRFFVSFVHFSNKSQQLFGIFLNIPFHFNVY